MCKVIVEVEFLVLYSFICRCYFYQQCTAIAMTYTRDLCELRIVPRMESFAIPARMQKALSSRGPRKMQAPISSKIGVWTGEIAIDIPGMDIRLSSSPP
jgi:hypothetical protein